MKKPAFRKKSGPDEAPEPVGSSRPAEPAEAAPAAGASRFAGKAGGTRTTPSLLAAAVVLAAVFGIAQVRPPAAPARADAAAAPSTAQVERTAAVCPQPLQGLTGSTTLTAYTPPGTGPATGGAGWLADAAAPAVPAAQPSGTPSAAATPTPTAPATPAATGSGAPAAPVPDKNAAPADARLTLAKPGTPASGPAANGDTASGTGAVGSGALAPGFTVTQTTVVTEQRGLGLSGLTCTPAGTGFWFAGASTAGDRVDYLSLVNTESSAAVVDIKLYGDKGLIENDAANGLTVAPGSSQSVLLSTLSKGAVTDLAVHVVVRSGRIGAALHAADGNKGADWIPASAAPAATQVLPGLPADTSSARLVVWAPPEDDADLKIQLSGKNGWFTPAGNESIHVKAGMVAAVDLGKVTRDEVAGLRLSPSDDKHPTPIVAGLRVDRAAGNGKSDAAWLTGSNPVGARATVADNRAGASTLFLTSAGDAATVRVTASAGSGGGTPATKEVQVPAGGTVALPAPEPAGLNGVFALTVETLSGGPVVAARMLSIPAKDVPMFTVQALRDDHSTVKVPQAAQDPGVVLR
ncbi:hypothetical protein GCM10018790_79090 [Kitasatospora xanthocidica]|uniref:DUF5719 family protein n=1 Tax=Kitasatospora xanthocidica TaxID=83382 RepID=UPI0019A82776|nr:DUF5719 family protein [Kitasatospora xanthocidica]GHF89983.1 hypothetical protein GCM10018790_79090 [Kitasatospora xanthocidica]